MLNLSIFDDTDVATYDNIRPVYDFLYDLNFKITKSVWPFNTKKKDSSYFGSHSLQNDDYLKLIKSLKKKGFEIGFHGCSMESEKRYRVIESLDYFERALGFKPITYACHAHNRENLYWGYDRFTLPLFKILYKKFSNDRNIDYSGHIPKSEYFWGDIAKETIKYIRTFTFSFNSFFFFPIPTIYVNPLFPYSNYCFTTHDADNVESFNDLICESNQDIWLNNTKIVIISTHFGKGFVENGSLNMRTKYLLKRLSKLPIKVESVSSTLNTYIDKEEIKSFSNIKLAFLELFWLIDFINRKIKKKKYKMTEKNYLYQ